MPELDRGTIGLKLRMERSGVGTQGYGSNVIVSPPTFPDYLVGETERVVIDTSIGLYRVVKCSIIDVGIDIVTITITIIIIVIVIGV
jgi:hypothetical protein